ncbi:MAG: hypothetical protein ACJ74Y_10865 [Bryobacteraceae bacterium]
MQISDISGVTGVAILDAILNAKVHEPRDCLRTDLAIGSWPGRTSEPGPGK